MPLNYIKPHNNAPNTLYYKLKNGDIKTRKNNVSYVYKKPTGIFVGTNLSYDEVFHMYQLYQQGMKIKALCCQFDISYYYFKKICKFVQGLPVKVLSDESGG
jgi:hypothetical protein